MASYLDLCNKVILESGKEQDLLTLGNWNSQEAGRRLYPRIKRLVKEAWRSIQMSRNEWEFNTAELLTTVYPRIKYVAGNRSMGTPAANSLWRGQSSNTVLRVRVAEVDSGSWTAGSARGQIEFETIQGSFIELSELFLATDGSGSFIYSEKGNYDFMEETANLIREPHWSTFVAGRGTRHQNIVRYIPWDNFTFKAHTFAGNNQNAPAYVTQDFEGKLVFHPQSIAPFTISFVHDAAPQELAEATDIPLRLPVEYHEWIAWLALMNLARYDKDPDLFAYAQGMYTSYQNRAERNLLPMPHYGANPYNLRHR